MYHVYILRSISCPDKIYVGFSSVELPTRLDRHNAGSTPATARYRPWTLAWSCSFPDKGLALAFEAYLKSGSGRAFLHKRLVPRPTDASWSGPLASAGAARRSGEGCPP